MKAKKEKERMKGTSYPVVEYPPHRGKPNLKAKENPRRSKRIGISDQKWPNRTIKTRY